MAETVTLRAYLDDIKRLLDRGAATEVISHCRYILQHYPRNVDTYRLLAQALLLKAEDQGSGTLYDEAVEVFQRILGVLPGDHIAHIGLSEIRDREGRLDQAIWHLERAYEQLPGNSMLQEGLRSLYAKRDGEKQAPAKIHLTRGALARQYVNGQLYDQALIELRHALEQNPSRLDLQVMLAETLLESQHVVEAGEVALQILKKLPDCLPANRIMARLWLDNERPSDAQVFLDRVEALDPYAAAQLLQPAASLPDPNRLSRLDYGTAAQSTLSQGTPDWVQDLGAADMGSMFPAPTPGAPDYAADRATPSDQFADSESSEDGLSFDWFTGQADATDAMPGDWFSAMAQDTPEETTPPSPVEPTDNWLNDVPAVSETGLPSWFADLDGPVAERESEAASFAVVEDEMSFDLPSEAEADWSDEPLAEPGAGMPDWFAELGEPPADTVPEPGGLASTEEDVSFDLPSEPGPDWSDEPLAEPGAGMPDWFAELGEPPIEGVPAQQSSEAAWPLNAEEFELPADHLGEVPTPEEAVVESPDAEWMMSFDSLEAGELELPGAEPAEVPDWLSGAGPVQEELATGSSTSSAEPELEEPTPVAEEEDWLDEFDAVTASAFEVVDDEEAAELNWPAAESEIPPALDELLGEPEVPIASDEVADDDLAAERASSGFTDLLEGIESRSGEPGTDEAVHEEPLVTPPEWLVAFAKDDEPGSELPIREALLSAEGQRALLEDAGSEEDEIADTAADIPASFAEFEEDFETEEFALQEEIPTGSEDQEQPEALATPSVPDWLTEPENDYFAPSPVSEDTLRAELEADSAAWPDEQSMDEELFASDFETTDLEELSPGSAEAEFERADQQPDIEVALSDLPAEPDRAQEADTPDLDDWTEVDSGPVLEVGESEAGAALDWLQPQATIEGDWLSSFAKPASEEPKLDLFEPEPLSFVADEEPADTSEPEAASAEPASEVRAYSEVEGDITAEDLPWEEAGQVVESDIQSPYAESEAFGSVEEDESPAWLADLPPVELSAVDAEDDRFDKPYDPYEAGSADNVPEYHSASQTGILQPNESPDWMAAFGDEEAAFDLEEEPEVEPETREDQEAFLTALGIEIPDEDAVNWDQPPDTVLASDALSAPDSQAEAVEEEGGMPDWLSAITASASGQFEDMFEEEESYSPLAEASGVVSERELDWLQPLGEDTETFSAETPGVDRLDLEAVFDPTNSSETAPLAPDTEADRATFDFELDEAQVAPADNLADTRGVEDTEVSWSEDESGDDEAVPDDFSFEETVPRWLREPKENDHWASSRPNEIPQTPDWLRDVFDDETDE